VYAVARNWVKHALLTLPVKIAALFVVPFLSPSDRINHEVFGADDATDLSWYNIAVRNGGSNFNNKPRPEYEQWPKDLVDETLEKESGFQWRARRSGDYASFRITWGEPRKSKGKKEFYTGWTMDKSRDDMGFSIIQLRMTWEWAIPALILFKVIF